jgi:hypothetical protein
VIWGDSPMYPSSASTRSLSSKAFNREWRKIVMSFHCPHGKGPLIHTMSPVAIVVAKSYLRPDFLPNLWDENCVNIQMGIMEWVLLPIFELSMSLKFTCS